MNISDIRQNSLITAIKTPFDSHGKIDLDSFDYLVEQQLKFGVDGLIIGGTTGEGHLLDWDEHLMLIAHAANQYGDKLLIVGNSGSNNTREAIKATQYGFASGMHASLQINPYYGKTSLKGVERHLLASLEVGPGFIYNVPGRTGQDIVPSVINQVAAHDNFIGVKECAGNDRIAEYERQNIACWSGNDDECFNGRHQYRSHGVISVTSNIVPGLMRKLMDFANESDLNQQLQPLFSWLFEEPNPIAINTALAMTRAIQPVFRLPYLPLEAQQRQQGFEILKKIEPSDLVGNVLELLQDDEFLIVN
ncbi:MAG: dihydrodipicolinate synthase family protein [Kangiellaceae bacterium]|nr:dihydrodipicolinate synthase family protein [Kangiellaceae bacterium]